jgi:hypothetical protein
LDGLYVRLAAEKAAQAVSMRVVPRQAAARKDSVRATQAATDAAQINRASFRQQPAPVVAGSELLIGKALLRYVSGRGSPVVG